MNLDNQYICPNSIAHIWIQMSYPNVFFFTKVLPKAIQIQDSK